MKKSLHLKLFFVMLAMILLLIIVVSAFLLRGVQDFYTQEFYLQMQAFFGDPEIASELQATRAAEGRTDYELLADRLGIYSGRLGILYGSRHYFVLDGHTGQWLAGSIMPGDSGHINTPNVFTALNGQVGNSMARSQDFMDVALPIETASGNLYIIQIYDTLAAADALSVNLFAIIWRTAIVGLVLSVFLSFLLSKTLVLPIQNLKTAAESIADGDFSKHLDDSATDEIGELAKTFNNMGEQLKDLVGQLEQGAQVQKDFVANVSHELRTPLTSVRTYAETLADSPHLPPQKQRELLAVLVDEADRMTIILQDLLTLAQLDGKRRPLHMEPFSLQSACNRALRAVAHQAADKEISLHTGFPDEEIILLGYRPGVEQIILNIVGNAVKYTGINGDIWLVATQTENAAILSIEDNGIGIPDEDKPRIFERFYRVDKGRSRLSGGTGLGLGLAKEMAERAGGTLTLESTLGKGTSVTITLPLSDKDIVRHEQEK